MDFLRILGITTPIYMVIALGYVAVRRGVFSKSDMTVLGRMLVLVLLPAMVFRTIASHGLSEILDLRYLLVYGGASIGVHLLGMMYAKWVRGKRMPDVAFFGMGMSVSNSVFIGYPIARTLLGPVADIALALCLLVENLLMIPFTLVMADSGAHGHWTRVLGRSLLALLKNPIFVSIALGFAFSALGLSLPSALDKSLSLLGSAAGALALFMIGGVLVGQQIRGLRSDIASIIVGKLLLHPVIVIGLSWWSGALPSPMVSAAILFACMPIPAVFPAIAQKYGLAGFCAATLVGATALSFLTLNLSLWLLPTVLGFMGLN